MKEIDQRSKTSLVIKCNCGGNHFIEFDYFKEDKYKEFWISIIDTPDTLWNRIKNAIKYIIGNGNLNWMEVGLTEKDLDKLINLINEYKKL